MLRFNFCLRQSTVYRKSLQKLPKLSFMRLGQLFENRLLLTISATFIFTIINSCDKETMCLLQSMLSRALVFTFQFRLFFFSWDISAICVATQVFLNGMQNVANASRTKCCLVDLNLYVQCVHVLFVVRVVCMISYIAYVVYLTYSLLHCGG